MNIHVCVLGQNAYHKLRNVTARDCRNRLNFFLKKTTTPAASMNKILPRHPKPGLGEGRWDCNLPVTSTRERGTNEIPASSIGAPEHQAAYKCWKPYNKIFSMHDRCVKCVEKTQ